MPKEEISQEQLDQLIKDAAYLQDEAEALKYVIDEVPYTETPPNGRSIAAMLLLIDHAQLSYYRPILEEAIKDSRPTHIDHFTHFEESFEPDSEKLKDIQKLLSKLAKHRAGVVNLIKNVSLIDWETIIYMNNQELSLFSFIQGMIRFDQTQLKKITELVMIYQQDAQNRREVKHHQSQQDSKPQGT